MLMFFRGMRAAKLFTCKHNMRNQGGREKEQAERETRILAWK